MKTIFVTGSLGFIGSHLSEFFLKNNYSIVGIDNLSNKYNLKVYKNNLNLLRAYKRFVFYKVNVLDQKKLIKLIKKHKPNYFIHCAAKVGVRESFKNPKLYDKVNVSGTQTLLEAIKQSCLKTRVILISSSSVYGNNKTPFSEKIKPKPLSYYGLSKYKMEKIAFMYYKNYHLPIVLVRAFSVYGPRGRTDMLPFLLIKKSLINKTLTIYGSNENNARDWTYITDFVDGIDKIIGKFSFKKFEIINIGRGQNIGINDFVNYFSSKLKLCGFPALKFKKTSKNIFEASNTLANIEKANKLLKFKPTVSYKEGINKTIIYFTKNKYLYFND